MNYQSARGGFTIPLVELLNKKETELGAPIWKERGKHAKNHYALGKGAPQLRNAHTTP